MKEKDAVLIVFFEIGDNKDESRTLRRPLSIFSPRSTASSAVIPPNLAGISAGRDTILPTDWHIITAEGLAESGNSGFLATTIRRIHSPV